MTAARRYTRLPEAGAVSGDRSSDNPRHGWVIHRTEAQIEMPAAMQPLWEKATKDGLPLAALWTSRKLNTWSDQTDIETITRKINGGKNGLVDRMDYFGRLALCYAVRNSGAHGGGSRLDPPVYDYLEASFSVVAELEKAVYKA
ncbi:hypothetical protein ABID21_001359 [Pseudorhizobium tarimense]|uniref:DUF4145 domain-containing protein n=1 Tax=Pseudorhizobium tarimense TaxID=1079109 RepID=A0ABV2H4B6_9HYPH|nr:hypothetical protein [Pseudorhizobium tarimense]MCJ8518331.1 hypothetical protein [Pseudorhizobium tarimense]